MGTPQGGVISPLLSNIYLHVLDRVWEDRCAHLGTLVRYADDFVVMCATKRAVEAARERVSLVLTWLGLELHSEKTRTVDLSHGREGFDFLGCHLHKRFSGPVWERTHRRVYYLHRWPSARAMRQVRTRVRGLTLRRRCHTDLRTIIADLNPVLRGWGGYFRTGNAAVKFIEIDRYVVDRLRTLLFKRHGGRVGPRRASAWRRPSSKSWDCTGFGARFAIRRSRNAVSRMFTGKPCAGRSSQQGCNPAGGSPAMSIAHFRHVAIPHPGTGNRPGDAWCKRPGCSASRRCCGGCNLGV